MKIVTIGGIAVGTINSNGIYTSAKYYPTPDTREKMEQRIKENKQLVQKYVSSSQADMWRN